jgi:hypothetical protein
MSGRLDRVAAFIRTLRRKDVLAAVLERAHARKL